MWSVKAFSFIEMPIVRKVVWWKQSLNLYSSNEPWIAFIYSDAKEPKKRHKHALLDKRSCGMKPVVVGDKKNEEDVIGGNLSHASDIALWRKKDVCLVG